MARLHRHPPPSRATVTPIADPKPLIVAGMHGSATALVGRLIAELGFDLGQPDDGIAELHRRVLAQACPPGEPGVRDWGWTESELLDPAVVEAGRESLETYAASRRAAAAGAWGFAEPRAVLLLDLWAQVVPDALFVLPFRAPWDDVAEALAEATPELGTRPDYAARVWLRYARAATRFASGHPDRCVVVDADAVASDPARLARALSLAPPPSATVQPAPRLDREGALAQVVRATAREVSAAYDELRRLAGETDRAPTRPAGPEAHAVGVLAAWQAQTVEHLRTSAVAQAAAGESVDAPAAASSARARARRLRARLSAGTAAAGADEPPPAVAAEPAPVDPAERWFREHYGEAADKTLAFLAEGGISMNGKVVADIGSGDGIIDLALVHRGGPRRLVGYDLRCTNREILAEQAGRYGVATELPAELEFEASQASGVPADDDAFDIVVTWSAFEHISDPVGVATEIRRVLRPGGVLFVQLWPFYRSGRGSHLWDWFAEPFHHLLEHEDDIVERMLALDVHAPDFTSYMAQEFRRLNRITIEELHRSLLAGGFRVTRVALMTDVVAVPEGLARYPLCDLAIGGVQLLAV
jgi:2-polyprenyl-3-methyl-5-hydroxy-6-metoxy-1,4-benzoquinol methylase